MTVNEQLAAKFPQWIWNEQKSAQSRVTISHHFTLDQAVMNAEFKIALTGGATVKLDGAVVGTLPDHPHWITQFTKVSEFPGVLEAGKHTLEIEISCEVPMPIMSVNAHLTERAHGFIGFLQGSGLWMTTDHTWVADGQAAAIVCRLGEEPYGDLEGGPEWFVSGGYGDLVAVPVQTVHVLEAELSAVQSVTGGIQISGQLAAESVVLPEMLLENKHIFYHIVKQTQWKLCRDIQTGLGLSDASSLVVDLTQELNARIKVTNTGDNAVQVLWNGAESLFELANYDGCITEWFSVAAGAEHYTLPQGMRYVRLQVLPTADSVGGSFDLQVAFESVEPDLPQIGSFKSDLPQLNRIYNVAAHTNRVCHQIGLWDGIKRDRLNWTYDFYMAAKGDYVLWNDFTILQRAIAELGRTPYGMWMNSIPAYTFWWVLNLWEYYWFTADKAFILSIGDDIRDHIRFIEESIDPQTGFMKEKVQTLIEWVPMDDAEALIGLHGVIRMTKQAINDLQQHIPELGIKAEWPDAGLTEQQFLEGSALVTPIIGIVSGYVSEEKARAHLQQLVIADPITPLSAYWLADSLSKYGYHEKAWDVVSTVWGAMLKDDATTFWESVILEPQKADFHDSQTTYTAYDSYRMSLCHSWASTPVQWISKYVLGVEPSAPGYAEYTFNPHQLPGLLSCSGTICTPHGSIEVAWNVQADGSLQTHIERASQH